MNLIFESPARERLQMFLSSSDLYDPVEVLDLIEGSELWLEKAILYRKLGQEALVLQILALFIEWMDCCCAGIENTQNAGEELLFPVSTILPCRDTMFQHPRTKVCDLLAQLPSSMPLDSGIYAQALISNQPSWLNFSNNTESAGAIEFLLYSLNVGLEKRSKQSSYNRQHGWARFCRSFTTEASCWYRRRASIVSWRTLYVPPKFYSIFVCPISRCNDKYASCVFCKLKTWFFLLQYL